MTSPTRERWTDTARPPLSQRALSAALVRPGSLVTEVRVVPLTGSTNDDVVELARAGAPEGVVLVAEEQTGGRGRLDRGWRSPPRAGLTFSVLLRPPATVAVHRRTWLPLLSGLAVQQAVERIGEVPVRLKWPNDVLLGDGGGGGGKAAGILVQADGGAVVVGIGLNVSTRRAELPPGGTSLAAEAARCTDRDPLLRAILRGLGTRYAEWCAAGGDPERPARRVRGGLRHARPRGPGAAAGRHRADRDGHRPGRRRPAGAAHGGRPPGRLAPAT